MTQSPKPHKAATLAVAAVFMAAVAHFQGVGCASAQTPVSGLSGFYVSGDVGTGLTNDPMGSDRFKTELSPGFLVGGAFGYDFGRFKVEGEIFYQGYEIDDQTKDGVSRGETIPRAFIGSPWEIEGTYSALATMLNGYAEFGPWERTRLFVGAGLGMATVSSKVEAVSRFLFFENKKTVVDDSDSVFAYQAMAGMLWQIGERIELVFKYRYFATEDPTFTDYTGATATQDGMRTHAVTFGARYKF